MLNVNIYNCISISFIIIVEKPFKYNIVFILGGWLNIDTEMIKNLLFRILQK